MQNHFEGLGLESTVLEELYAMKGTSNDPELFCEVLFDIPYKELPDFSLL